MRSLSKRAWVVLGLGVVAVSLVPAALAYACTAAATLTVSPSAAPAGSTVTVTGRFFGTHDPASDTSNSPAQIRLGSLSGPILATGAPAGDDRSFTVEVTVPEVPAGDTFLAGTQKTARGTTVYGTPARQAFTVTPPAGSTAAAGSPPAPAAVVPVTTATGRRARALRACSARYKKAIRRNKSRSNRKKARRSRSACMRRARKLPA